ncbi:MAG: YdiU family protein [Albidovulum sp.]
MTVQDAIFTFDNSYARELEGFYIPWQGANVPDPKMLRLNHALAEELGFDPAVLNTDAAAAIFAGKNMPDGARPLAMAYAGHQFGGFSPQLGDGRALLIGEVIDRTGNRRDIHLKGSGRTPFSRGGDGKAVLGPVLREYLLGEAMHGLGVPTTRALAAVTTGEAVARDGGYRPGAVLARVASSHLRVGTFQFFAARGETDKLRQLADYAIARHYPDLTGTKDRYLGLLARVSDAQAALVAQWMLVGFVHGVMNTDNMTISGETIDYGPCAFIDAYDSNAVFSSIDRQGRYAYGNQPTIAQWNLARLAETLLDLINPDDADAAIGRATEVVNAFPQHYQNAWLKGMRAKLGLSAELAGDLELINDLQTAMAGQNVDFTSLFRHLADVVRGDASMVRALFDNPAQFGVWLQQYQSRGDKETVAPGLRATAMDATNPAYIPRNHMVEAALASALEGDMAPFDELLTAITHPFDVQESFADYARPAPEGFGHYTTYCGT